MSELTQITQKLAAAEVRFVVVGGLASILHGSSLLTRDVDVACEMSPENLLRVWESVRELNPVHRMLPQRPTFTREQARQSGWKNLYLSTELGQLDLLGEVKGVGDYSACFKFSDVLRVKPYEIRVLKLDTLIAAKRAMGRPRDLHAVLELEAIKERRSTEESQ
jgi:hypothetical protein